MKPSLRLHAKAIARRIARHLVKPFLRPHVENLGPAPSPAAQLAPTELAKLERCLWCQEPLEDNRHPNMRSYHIECAVRSVSGSLAHVEQRCSCYVPGAPHTDPPGMTRREAALAVYKIVRARHHGPAN